MWKFDLLSYVIGMNVMLLVQFLIQLLVRQ
jgi:hypothetical protein